MNALPAFAIIGRQDGANLARHALDKGLAVAGFTKGEHADLAERGMQTVVDIAALKRILRPPRIVFSMSRQGRRWTVIGELAAVLEKATWWSTAVIRTGATRSGVTLRRGIEAFTSSISEPAAVSRRAAWRLLHGGWEARRSPSSKPILRRLAVSNGYVHLKPSGAGHYVSSSTTASSSGCSRRGGGHGHARALRDAASIDGILAAGTGGDPLWLLDLMEGLPARAGGIPPFVRIRAR